MIPKHYLHDRHSILQTLDYKKPFKSVPIALTEERDCVGPSNIQSEKHCHGPISRVYTHATPDARHLRVLRDLNKDRRWARMIRNLQGALKVAQVR